MRPACRSSRSARIASLSTARSLGALEQKVRAPRLEAGEVERDVDVTQLAQALHDGLVTPVLPEPGELVVGDLEPGHAVVVPDAELAEAERAHERLGRVDLTELLGGDPVALLATRGQAGQPRPVPPGQSQFAQKGS